MIAVCSFLLRIIKHFGYSAGPAILALCCCFSPSVEASRLHVLLLCDTADASIGAWAAADRRSMSAAFKLNVREADLNLVTLSDNQLSASNSINALRQIVRQALPDDAILVYFSGHGGYDKDGHHLVTGRERLRRLTVLQELKKKDCRLRMLITDACFQEVRVPTIPADPAFLSPLETTPLFHNLFFKSRGMLDINSCTKTQQAWCHPNNPIAGSIFTRIIIEEFEKEANNPRYGWNDLITQLAKQTPVRFRQFVSRDLAEGQTSQDPLMFTNYIVHSGERRNDPVMYTRLGLLIEEWNGQLLVRGRDEFGFGSRLKEPGKALNWTLDPGDIIDEFNGIEVSTHEQIRDILDKAEGEVGLKVRSNGKTYEFIGNLN